MINATNKYADVLYARGYVICKGRIPRCPPHWVHSEFSPDISLAHDPKLLFNSCHNQDAKVICFGLLFDVRSPELSTARCVAQLAEALSESETWFLRELGYMCGRHVCLYQTSTGDIRIVTDAAGMKAAFYFASDPATVSSHTGLIQENEPRATPAPRVPIKYGYPGLGTPQKGVYRLPPNMTLDLATLSIVRFWPAAAITRRNIDNLTDHFSRNIQNSFDFIARNFRPIVSITAGLDSRVTLAASRDRQDVEFFCYISYNDRKADRVDLRFINEAEARGIAKVKKIYLGDYTIDREFGDIVKRNVIGSHSHRLAWAYYKEYANCNNIIHVRSNIAEVGREFWRAAPPVMTSSALRDVYYLSTVERTHASNILLDDMIEKTGILKYRHHVDLKSLFYWEFRMGAWHSQVVAESDPAFDSASVYNCRDTLAVMLSADRDSRTKGTLQKNFIRNKWPELTEFPVNERSF